MKIKILRGLPASGKSTYANNIVNNSRTWKRINKDSLRLMMNDGTWSEENEKAIVKARNALLVEFLKNDYNIIIDDTNFADRHIADIRAIGDEFGAEIEIKDFTYVSIKECIDRDKDREKPVGEKVILEMAKKYLPEKYKEEFKYVPDKTKPKAVIFDIDGTLALNNSGRSPYDWLRVGDDDYNEPVWCALNNYYRNGYTILYFSGRSDECLDDTSDWISKKEIKMFGKALTLDEGPLEMRTKEEQENKTCDTIVKKRMFDEYKDEFNIEAVFDDRPKVLKMWKELGLHTFDCNQDPELKPF